jgi:serine/threonine protein kinase
MPLETGARLGSYTVVGLLGTGGMGEIYRARDERLARDVAVKILAPGLAGDTKEHERFEREARTLASLAHPNVLNIFDVGEHDGLRYAVMELLEGGTLRERLVRGALPWRTAVAIAMAVAKGLAAVHAKGIIHRDIKPENVFLLADGGVKVLDFGLAHRESAPGAEPQPEPETLIGTVVYMAPEQIMGIGADARTDIFALGALLHEMLTGDRPFGRVTVGETMGAILNAEPLPLEPRAGKAPAALARVIRRCLEKEPDQRLQSALDVAFALSEVTTSPRVASPQTNWWARVAWFLAGVAVGAAATALLVAFR